MGGTKIYVEQNKMFSIMSNYKPTIILNEIKKTKHTGGK